MVKTVKKCSLCDKNANPKCVRSQMVWKEADTSWTKFEEYCNSEENQSELEPFKLDKWKDEDYYKWKKENGSYQDFIFTFYCKPCYKKITAPPKWETPKKIKEWKYTNNEPLINMSKAKLKNRIEKDIVLLHEQLPLENTPLNEDDTDTWDTDACGDLISAIDKIKEIVESENGLNDKLELWSNYQEAEEEGENNDT